MSGRENSLASSQLIASLKIGDQAAFDQIFNNYWEFTYLSAFKRLQDEDAAKDIAQDLFISLWERRESLEINNISAWLYTSVRFRVINYLKSASIGDRYHQQLGKLMDDHYLFHAMDKQDTEVVFAYVMNGLPQRMRQIFEMSRKQEKSIDEIAVELHISSQTVKNQLSSALKIVRKKLNHPSFLIFLLAVLTDN